MTPDSRVLSLEVSIERWPLASPFRITGFTFECMEVVVVRLLRDGCVGRAEAAGVYYKNDIAPSIVAQIEKHRDTIEAGLTREALSRLLPPGGARNALDCALWDLEAKLTRTPVWKLAGFEQPKPLVSTYTCSADVPDRLAARARGFSGAQALKLKLTGEPIDADCVRAVREARTDVWLGVDANQGLTPDSLHRLMPVLLEARVALIEQPFRVGEEHLLEGLKSAIPIAADESVQCAADIEGLVGRFDVVNIKLDKCGGLTEALVMIERARAAGLGVMVGNMLGTSLAMAPGFLVGQACSIIDLDGPVFLKKDRECAAVFRDGRIFCSDALWGGAFVPG